MLHKCANASCSNRFRRLSDGKLFQVESERFQPALEGGGRKSARRVEHFWLCTDCCSQWTLSFESGRGVTVLPLTSAAKRPVSAIPVPDYERGALGITGTTQA
ncbi:MAG: hypothetical protein H0X25_22255 [Acidobacteriales bacterium]|nr:hypothetical protein [Terriglobales bacterium]